MNQILIFIIGFVVGVITARFLLYRKNGAAGGGSNIPAYFEERKLKKDANKALILAELGKKEAITNNDVERILGVGDTMATNYLDELEREGKIKQIGKSGRGVQYQLPK